MRRGGENLSVQGRESTNKDKELYFTVPLSTQVNKWTNCRGVLQKTSISSRDQLIAY